MSLCFRTLISLIVVAASVLPCTLAIGKAAGYGNKATGGGSATPQTPASTTELLNWLRDGTPRVILLTSIYDFSNYYGTTTGDYCKPWSCSPNPQEMLDTQNNWCATAAGQTTYYNSGTSTSYSLTVGSNKTLLGQGSNAGIRGIGLRIGDGVSNIIIQNIKITDINARYVWGGDAIGIDNASNVWIDHNYINRIGRQFIVTGFGAANGVTISNNYFDGHADYSTGCDGHHYWMGIFAGNGDRVTFINNRITYTAGRGPHTGADSGTVIRLHLVNNYFDSISGHALDIGTGTYALAEGNYFENVNKPSQPNTTGSLFFLQSSSELSTCASKLGRTCQGNALIGSGSVAARTNDVWGALAGDAAVSALSVTSASAARTYVLANAGVGKIN